MKIAPLRRTRIPINYEPAAIIVWGEQRKGGNMKFYYLNNPDRTDPQNNTRVLSFCFFKYGLAFTYDIPVRRLSFVFYKGKESVFSWPNQRKEK